MSFPLEINDHVLGAVNFYSKEREALRPDQHEEGWIFASQAAIALANAKELRVRSPRRPPSLLER